MNKKYLNAILFGAFALATVTFTGCKDYDDDIDDLTSRVDVVEKGLADLKSDFSAFGQIAYVKGVTYDDATRTLTITPSNGAASTYHISDADTKPGVDVNTEYELKVSQEGNKTTIKLVEKGTGTVVGDVAEVVDTNDNTVTPEFDPTKMFVKEIDGKKTVCYGDPEGEYKATSVIIPTIPTIPDEPETTITAITQQDQEGEVKVIGYMISSKIGNETIENSFYITDSLPISSFEYIPEKILDGWGERVIVFNRDNYKELEIKDKKEVVTKKTVRGDEIIQYLPNTAAPRFHVNPASATPDQLVDKGKAKILNATVEKETRARDGVITWKSTKVAEGQPGVFVVTLDAAPAGLTTDADKLDEIALQFESKEGEVYTTEYVGVINKSEQLNLKLADKHLTKDNDENIDNETHHFALSLREAIDNQKALVGEDNKATPETAHLVQQILYSEAIKGVDLKTLVTACNFNAESNTHKFYPYKDNDNLELSFELIPYDVESTPQDKYAKLEGTTFTAINYDLTQSKSCIGKAPIVLAKLTDKHNNALMAAAYIKLLIVGDEAAPADNDIYINHDVHIGIGCNTPKHTWSTNDEFMSTEVYTFAHKAEGSNLEQLSKEQFHVIYKLDKEISGESGKDFANGTAIYEGSTTQFVGDWNIKETINNEDGKSNHEVTFTLRTASLAAGETYKAYAVYTKTDDRDALSNVVNNNMYPERVVIVYNVTVDKINFKASIKDGNKISNYWNAEQNKIDIYCDTPFGTAAIKQDLLSNFEGHDVAFTYSSEFNAQNYPSFAESNMSYKFRFATDNTTRTVKATDVDGNTYNLFLNDDQTELHAEPTTVANPTLSSTNLVASLSGDLNEKITYANTEVAKALLNRVGRNDEANAFFATLEVVYENGCGMEVPVTNGKFDAYFIRPVNATANNEKSFKDGGNEGTYTLKLGELVDFTDWRNESPLNSFAKNLNYYKYYGVTKIEIDNTKEIKTNLNRDANTFVDIETIFGEDGAKTLLTTEDPAPSVTYDSNDVTEIPNFGTITYKNKDVEVKETFKLQIPLVITYKWGTIKETITVEVSKTL